MTIQDLKDRIASLTQDVTFDYKGKSYIIMPFNQNKFTLSNENSSIDRNSIDEVMNSPFFDGKSLTQIADRIKLT